MKIAIIFRYSFAAIILSLYLSSCTRDELINSPPPFVKSTVGAYVLSEGGFSAGTSKLSLYDVPNDTFYHNIFNPGNLGLFPSGMILKDNYLYILEQGNYGSPGKIYKLDTTGKILNSSVIGLNPYSLAINNSKIYFTNGPSSNVGVLNLNDFSLIKYIATGVYPQEIISFGSKIFVCNTSIFGGNEDSTISVIDSQTDLSVARINVKKDPYSIAVTRNNKLIVGCYGSNGYIFLIDPDNFTKTDSFSVPEGFGKDLNIDSQSNNIYFISYAGNIVKLDLNTKISNTIIHNLNPAISFFYGYSFDSKNRKHYICDARNFSSNGYFMVIDMDNMIEKNFSTGISPRRIVLKSD
jgi:YVTN family beta-propeller protein